MKKVLPLIAIFCALNANAQNYFVTFEGTGASTTVSTVKVDNLTANTSLTVNGSDILHLTFSTVINPNENRQFPEMKIYPNPMTDNSIVQIYPPEAGLAMISVIDISGKLVSQIQSYLNNSLQVFRFSGFKSGFYVINVKGHTYQSSGKLLSNSKSFGTISIEKLSNNQSVDEKTTEKDLKGVQVTVEMGYTTGDMLVFTGTSGDYSTVVTDTPSSDKKITFNFVACTDGDGNNYPVIETGTGGRKCPPQTWMAANLKTTKYNDGITIIPQVTDKTAWSNLDAHGYCWYDNKDAEYKDIYGALYNWYALNSGKLCPVGWRIASNDDWLHFTDYFLGGASIAGGKLKETDTAHWKSPNAGATNKSGFTARPGGFRNYDGSFSDIGSYGYWWSATANDATTAWARSMYYDNDDVGKNSYNKKDGFSVRCMKD
jgi:uncharacterized protein (TIGR02145 family)